MNEIDARAQYLAGVRELITWLEQNPTQPLPASREFNVPVRTNSAVKDWAADNDMTGAVQYDEEGNASIHLPFGPVALHVYGYADFAEHCDRTDGRNAREYAEKHGLVLVKVPAADDADTEAYIEACVEVADAERDALRDEYVNATETKTDPDFKPDDLVNISDPSHKLFGTRGVVVGSLYPDGVVVEYDNRGNTVTVSASQLMHHTEFVKQPDEFFAAAERNAESEA